jgi:hypothetical protein
VPASCFEDVSLAASAKLLVYGAMTKDSRELSLLTPAFRVRTQAEGLLRESCIVYGGDPRLGLAVVRIPSVQ